MASKVLVVGAGGLGCPVSLALARAGVPFAMADDDIVERSNLHRQILFGEDDVGRPKLDCAERTLRGLFPNAEIELVRSRVLPENAVPLTGRFELVVEGSDNFPTKFLVADACALARIPVVHGSAVRWHGTALAIGKSQRPCYRCLFEDIPHEHVQNCAEAGVMGPACGIIGALMADLALKTLAGRDVAGTVVSYDGKTDRLRRHVVSPRADCPLCGTTKTISTVDRARYVPASAF